jgi:hypothetical protein
MGDLRSGADGLLRGLRGAADGLVTATKKVALFIGGVLWIASALALVAVAWWWWSLAAASGIVVVVCCGIYACALLATGKGLYDILSVFASTKPLEDEKAHGRARDATEEEAARAARGQSDGSLLDRQRF